METAPCPSCSKTDATPQKFTWWGGVLGPKILNHVKCDACGTTYNAKTGKSNNTAIAIYMVVVTGVALVAFGALAAL